MKYLLTILLATVLTSSCVQEDVTPAQDIEQEKSKERGITIKTSGDDDRKN